MSWYMRDDLHDNVKRFVDDAAVAHDVSFDQIDLSASMGKQAGLVAYYGELCARAEAQVAYMRRAEEILQAQLIKSTRAVYAAKGDPKISETRLEKEVQLNPSLIDIQRQVTDSRYVLSVLQSIQSALQDRRAMMLGVARSNTSQFYGNPSVPMYHNPYTETN